MLDNSILTIQKLNVIVKLNALTLGKGFGLINIELIVLVLVKFLVEPQKLSKIGRDAPGGWEIIVLLREMVSHLH